MDKKFDEVVKESAERLLEQFWVLREQEPELYQRIREREEALRKYFLEKLGFRLIIHRHFAKLEKVPVIPEPWMGIQNFVQVRDYTLFCCLMAYLEGKAVDEQFLLSNLCEELSSLFPQKDGLDWTDYEHRKSLVRILQMATDMNLIKVVEGNIADFGYYENNEVLYEVPLVSRYFMRSYPKDLWQFQSMEELLAAEWMGQEEATGINRRHRVYRQLFLTPAVYSKGTNDADFLYLRNYRNRIREDIETHTDYQFELYKNVAMLTMPEKKALLTLFPDNRAISDIALQFAAIVRQKRQEQDIPLQYEGTLCLTRVDFEAWVSDCKERFGTGWSKQYRESLISETAKDLLNLLIDWKMATVDKVTGVIHLQPLLVRLTGKYPKDYVASLQQEVEADGNK